jgi:nicotinamide-nucleotide amidase
MVENELLPYLTSLPRNLKPSVSTYLRIFGLPEAEAAKRIESLQLDKATDITYRVCFPEIEIGVIGPERAIIDRSVTQIINILGPEHITSQERGSGLIECVHNLMLKNSLTLALAESCTGGLIGSLLTATSGSSAYFLGSAVTYSNKAKKNILQVSPLSLDRYGAVSAEVAKEMAYGARMAYQADLAVSVTGIAGPSGGTSEKPVGLFFVGFSAPDRIEAVSAIYPSTRDRIRRYAAYRALEVVKRHVEQQPLVPA